MTLKLFQGQFLTGMLKLRVFKYLHISIKGLVNSSSYYLDNHFIQRNANGQAKGYSQNECLHEYETKSSRYNGLVEKQLQ